ncbi:MAG: adenylate/guanylate cyclase domain-containing protein, partial [Thermodesulfobacteriota bacterium]
LGAVHVGVSLDFIHSLIRKDSISILVLSLFIVLLGISISVLLGIGFSRPISKLVLATEEIGKGNFHYRLDMIRKDEFGDLASAFNFMARELRQKMVLQKSFGSYVSPEVLDMILSHPGESWLKGTLQEVTVLFADVRGFTAYSENRDPEKVVEDLNEYFQVATQSILEQGGYIDKFIGDAVLAVFGAPVQKEDHARRAVQTAWTMQEILAAQSEKSHNPLLSRIGIGINSGTVLSGNLGSQVKMEYTVIGDNVNIASRLNGLAGPGEIIISQSCYEAAEGLAKVEALPAQQLKGKKESIRAYRITGIQVSQPALSEENKT